MKIAILHMTAGMIDRGSEVYFDMLAKSLAKNHELLFCQSGPRIKSQYRIMRIHPLSQLPRIAPTNWWQKILFRLKINSLSLNSLIFTFKSLVVLKKFSPNIVIAVNGGWQVIILKLFLNNAKIVVFGQAGIGHDDRFNLLVSPHLFIAPTEQAAGWAKVYAKKDTKVAMVPNPIDLHKYMLVKPTNLAMDHPILITVGALTAYKNILSLVSVASSLSLNLVIVGDGELATKLSSMLSNYLGKFRWIKHANPSELPSLYMAADAFAFTPDSQEAFGMVYLEAMAAGLPIVASDDPVRRSIVGSKGFYADPHNPDSLRQAIKRALSSGRIDYSRELEKYKIETVVTQLESLFKELL